MLKLRQYKQNRLILASASPRRIDLLRQIKILPDQVIPASIDETPHIKELPADYALRMAVEKAEQISNRLTDECDVSNGHVGSAGPSDVYVLAGDTVVAVGRRILPKAETAQDARECLAILSGRRHRVYGGIALHSLMASPIIVLCKATFAFGAYRHWILTNTLIMVIGGARLVVMPFRGWLHGL